MFGNKAKKECVKIVLDMVKALIPNNTLRNYILTETQEILDGYFKMESIENGLILKSIFKNHFFKVVIDKTIDEQIITIENIKRFSDELKEIILQDNHVIVKEKNVNIYCSEKGKYNSCKRTALLKKYLDNDLYYSEEVSEEKEAGFDIRRQEKREYIAPNNQAYIVEQTDNGSFEYYKCDFYNPLHFNSIADKGFAQVDYFYRATFSEFSDFMENYDNFIKVKSKKNV